ncbi:MAG: tetratricopeptide repeat protein, partial [bacterium]
MSQRNREKRQRANKPDQQPTASQPDAMSSLPYSAPMPWKIAGFWGTLAAILLTVAVLYASVVGHPFIYDDVEYIATNTLYRPGHGMGALFTTPYPYGDAGTGLFRPLTAAVFWTEAQLGSFSPRVFFAGNLIWYLALCGLVFAWFHRLLGSFGAAAVAAAVFALHPYHAESVNWTVARAGTMSATCGVGLMWLAGEKRLKLFRPARIVLECLLYAGAVLLYESAILLPAAVGLQSWLVRDRGRIAKPTSPQEIIFNSARLASLGVVMLLVLFWRWRVLGGLGPQDFYVHGYLKTLNGTSRFLLPFQLLIKHLVGFLVPLKLSVLQDPHGDNFFFPLPGWLSVVGVIALLVGLWIARLRRPLVAFGLGLFVVGTLPSINILSSGQVFSERTTLLSSLGLCIVLGVLISVLSRCGIWREIAYAVVAIWCVMAVVRDHARTAEWSSPFGFWVAESKRNPYHPHPLVCVGALLDKAGNTAEATKAFEKALELDPRNVTAYGNLANFAMNAWDLDKAETLLDKALAVQADQPDMLARKGWLRYRQKRYQEALEIFQRVLELRSDQVEALLGMGMVGTLTGRPQVSAEALTRLRKTAPEYHPVEAAFYLGTALKQAGRPREAEQRFSEALSLDPRFSLAVWEWADLLIAEGDYGKAEDLLTKGLQVVSGRDSQLMFLAGEVLIGQGQISEAAQLAERYVKIS